MWLRRTKSTTPFHQNTLPPFSCTSFKDIQSLFAEETPNNNNNSSNSSNCSTAKSPSSNIFHRVRSAKSLLHAISNQRKTEENVQKTKQTLKSFHHDDKDNGVIVFKRGLSEGNKSLVEDSKAIGELIDVTVKNKSNGVIPIELPGTETRVVIYFTSLRVVRSTFEDCKYVLSVLHSFPVAIDERDLFMDGRFMKELQSIMGKDENTYLTLPRVFIGGRYFGGAEEIRQLHEAGELKKYLEGLAPAPAGTCEVCGGPGFILCVECNGSHKCFVDKGGFKTCTGCNENGLVRCPSCSCASL